MPRRPCFVISTLVAVMAATASVATAQGPTVRNPPNTMEFGIDAGLQFGLGDVSTVQFTLPASRARVGFYLNNDSRWSIEPAAGLSYSKAEGGDGVFVYDLEVGALYHFRTPSMVGSLHGGSPCVFHHSSALRPWSPDVRPDRCPAPRSRTRHRSRIPSCWEGS